MKKRWDTGGRKSVSWLTKMGRKDRSGILASTRSFTGKIYIYIGEVLSLLCCFLYLSFMNSSRIMFKRGFCSHACCFSYLPGHYILMNYSQLHSVEFEKTCSISSERVALQRREGAELGKTKGMPQTWK